MKTTFKKLLSANDVGETGSHQAGIHIPKRKRELIDFFPKLDARVKNPEAWIECLDENDVLRRFRYIYYNNRLHDEGGTRNEYRITHMTSYFKEIGARPGDTFEISRAPNASIYAIRVAHQPAKQGSAWPDAGVRIRLTSSWSRAH